MEKMIDVQVKVPASDVVDALLECLRGQPMPMVRTGQLPRIGQPWPGQGGVYAGMMKGVNGVADYPLILPTDPSAYLKSVTWGPRGVDVPGSTCEYDGLKNTMAIIEVKGEFPAAAKVNKLVIEGHQDFYLPSRRELALLYANVPELVETGDWYWSSTQYSSDSAWCQDFGGGRQGYLRKGGNGRVRAVRRVLWVI